MGTRVFIQRGRKQKYQKTEKILHHIGKSKALKNEIELKRETKLDGIEGSLIIRISKGI
jgi:hypothetical protein